MGEGGCIITLKHNLYKCFKISHPNQKGKATPKLKPRGSNHIVLFVLSFKRNPRNQRERHPHSVLLSKHIAIFVHKIQKTSPEPKRKGIQSPLWYATAIIVQRQYRTCNYITPDIKAFPNSRDCGLQPINCGNYVLRLGFTRSLDITGGLHL